jgi:hypothetical protein
MAERDDFNDRVAAEVLTKTGLRSAWMRQNRGSDLETGVPDSFAVLSQAALDSHVNNFGVAQFATPYISLTAGCFTIDPVTGTSTPHSAREIAIGFATGAVWGNRPRPGYLFHLWVLVTPKPGPELPGFGEEIRDLNQFAQYWLYHAEGEIAGKLIVPHRQIRSVEKVDKDGTSLPIDWTKLGLNKSGNEGENKDFVQPERIHNLRDLV